MARSPWVPAWPCTAVFFDAGSVCHSICRGIGSPSGCSWVSRSRAFSPRGSRIALLPLGVDSGLPLGAGVAHALRTLGLDGAGSAQLLRTVHVLTAACFWAVIPFTRLRHMIVAPFAILFAARPLGSVRAEGEGRSPSWALRMQLDACSACGRCDQACPPAREGGALSPMRLALEQRRRPETPDVSLEALEACTACGACEEACPVGISHMARIALLRPDRLGIGSPPGARSTPVGDPNGIA